MKKRFIGLCSLMMVVSMCTTPALAANTVDTDMNIPYMGGSTEMRSKQDASSIYVWPQDSDGTTFLVNVYGTNYVGTGDYECNDGRGGRILQKGVRYFLYNDVYEKGYDAAFLEVMGTHGSYFNYLHGPWSPDSVWENGVVPMSADSNHYTII